MDRKSNLRDISIGPESGEAKQTHSQVAHPTSGWKAKNEVKEYETGTPTKGTGPLGGRNSRS